MEQGPIPTRRIGSLEVSVVGLGCNNFGSRIDEAATMAVVDAALDVGINFFDTADIYGSTNSETFLGRAVKDRRDEVVLATKFGGSIDGVPGGARPEYVKEALTASLSRLGVDQIDLYQLHRPDPDTPIAETLGALEELVNLGLIREIGCSNFTAEQLGEAEAVSREVRFVSVQNELSMLKRGARDEVLPVCDQLGISFLPYFPLLGGLLSGKYRKGEPLPQGTRVTGSDRWEAYLTDTNLDTIESLIQFSAERGFEIVDLAFAWLLSHDAVASVIAGATTPEQVRRNAATASWTLSSDELAVVEGILNATA